MAHQTHWPFDQGESAGEAHRMDHAQEREAERRQAQAISNAARAAHARSDRLIVGGRAHVKKQGLS